jgi:hypothetical protein
MPFCGVGLLSVLCLNAQQNQLTSLCQAGPGGKSMNLLEGYDEEDVETATRRTELQIMRDSINISSRPRRPGSSYFKMVKHCSLMRPVAACAKAAFAAWPASRR